MLRIVYISDTSREELGKTGIGTDGHRALQADWMDARHDASLQVGVDPPYDCPLVPTYFSHFLVLGPHGAGK